LLWASPFSPSGPEYGSVTLTRNNATVTSFAPKMKYKIDDVTADPSQYIAIDPYGVYSAVVDVSQSADTSTAGSYSIKADDLVRDYYVGDTFPAGKVFANAGYTFSASLNVTVASAAQVNRRYARQVVQFNSPPPTVSTQADFIVSDACTGDEISAISQGMNKFYGMVHDLYFIYVVHPVCDLIHHNLIEPVQYTNQGNNAIGPARQWAHFDVDIHFEMGQKSFPRLGQLARNLYLELARNPIYVQCRSTTCTSHMFAFVEPDSPYNVINLCPKFFAANESVGFDIRGGVFLHEMSHFTRLGGTDDIVYGETSARGLFQTDPGLAMMNADNIEYAGEFRMAG